MGIYPFYVTSQADGRKSPIAGGCRRKDGYQTTEIMQRDKGVPKTIATIRQTSHFHPETGKTILMCQIYVDGEVIKTIETEY